MTSAGDRRTRLAHVILNACEPPPLPTPAGRPARPWRRIIDTALDPPDDVAVLDSAPPVRGATYRADAHSVVMLCADLHDVTDTQHAPAP